MRFTYFKALLGKPSQEAVEQYYGAFDPSEVDPKNLEKAQAAYEERLKTGPFRDPKVGTLVAIGYLNPDGTTDVDSAEVGDESGEKALLTNFWTRYNDTGGAMAGWGVHAEDLYCIKVRSWALGVKIPTRAMRPAGVGRTSWIGFTDVRSEFDGRPKGEDTSDFSEVARTFGLKGAQASPEEFFELWSSGAPDDRQAAVERLQDDLAQTAAIAVSIGLDRDLPPLGIDVPINEPKSIDVPNCAEIARAASTKATHFDIETGPGELANLKRIIGEFDPSKVKVGNLKDPAKIRAKIEAARLSYDEDLLKASMLDPKLGRIVAIGYKRPDGTVEIPRLTEKELLIDFWSRVETAGGPFEGWNIFGFDLRYIVVRSWLHGIQPPARVMSLAGNGYTRWTGFVDLMREFLGNPHGYLALADAAKLFGLDGKTGDGADFYKLWESEDPAERQKAFVYLTRDVDLSQGVAVPMGLDGIDVSGPEATASVPEGAKKRAEAIVADVDIV